MLSPETLQKSTQKAPKTRKYRGGGGRRPSAPERQCCVSRSAKTLRGAPLGWPRIPPAASRDTSGGKGGTGLPERCVPRGTGCPSLAILPGTPGRDLGKGRGAPTGTSLAVRHVGFRTVGFGPHGCGPVHGCRERAKQSRKGSTACRTGGWGQTGVYLLRTLAATAAVSVAVRGDIKRGVLSCFRAPELVAPLATSCPLSYGPLDH